MAKTFHQKPSSFFRVEDEYDAYRIDRAVWTFGDGLEEEMNKVDEDDQNKRRRAIERIFEKWIPEAAIPVEKRFADPAARE